jgi:hypothetical protein
MMLMLISGERTIRSGMIESPPLWWCQVSGDCSVIPIFSPSTATSELNRHFLVLVITAGFRITAWKTTRCPPCSAPERVLFTASRQAPEPKTAADSDHAGDGTRASWSGSERRRRSSRLLACALACHGCTHGDDGRAARTLPLSGGQGAWGGDAESSWWPVHRRACSKWRVPVGNSCRLSPNESSIT